MVWLCKTKTWWKCKTLLDKYRQLNRSYKTNDIYKGFAEDVQARCDTSSFEIDWPLPKIKNKKSNWTNERWIRWINHEMICWIKSKNI